MVNRLATFPADKIAISVGSLFTEMCVKLISDRSQYYCGQNILKIQFRRQPFYKLVTSHMILYISEFTSLEKKIVFLGAK